MKLKHYLITFILLTRVMIAAHGQPTELEVALFNLPDVIFEKIDTPADFQAAYELKVKQPLDHDHPEKGYFYQRVFLSHAGFDRPAVIITEGYTRDSNRIYELTRFLQANQLDVEHRYFGASTPDTMDYTYLNLKQTTADLHHIRELFGKLYQGKWISTGISKGGQTTIFYKYFYPDDVDVSVPYVAPLNLEAADKRIYAFLDSVGTPTCRKAIRDFQVEMLQRRDDLLPLLRWYAEGAGYSFTYLSLEEAFEYAVLEYPFSFWQMGHNCSAIPGADADNNRIIEHFNTVVGLSLYNDESMEAYGSHYYQAATEMGYYGYETQPFKGLLKVLKGEPLATFVPGKMKVKQDLSLMQKVYDWLQTKGENMIYIYGGTDTWTATGVPPSDQTNSVWITLEGQDHGGARIKNMNAAEKQLLKQTLEKWLGMEILERP